MARIIRFHKPTNFTKKVTTIPQSQLGKLIVFRLSAKKSA